jgi:hypothetical protein
VILRVRSGWLVDLVHSQSLRDCRNDPSASGPREPRADTDTDTKSAPANSPVTPPPGDGKERVFVVDLLSEVLRYAAAASNSGWILANHRESVFIARVMPYNVNSGTLWLSCDGHDNLDRAFAACNGASE